MIETLALRIAESIKRAEPDKTASVAVMQYALIGILNNLVTLLFLVIIGILTGALAETIFGLTMFALLRFFSGGLHLRSAMHCSIFSTLALSVAPHIPMTREWVIGAGIVTIVILAIFAPSNIQGHARIPEKYFPLLKIVSILIASTNFLMMSSAIAIVFLIQAITTIRFERR